MHESSSFIPYQSFTSKEGSAVMINSMHDVPLTIDSSQNVNITHCTYHDPIEAW